MRRLLPIVAPVLLAPSASAHAASFPVGAGQNPGVAIDGTGTAYVGWQTEEHAIQLCVLPARARSCAALTNIAFPGDGYGGRTFGPAIRISDQGFEQAVPGPDGRLALVGGIQLNAGVVAPDGSGRGTEGAELGGGLVGQFPDIAAQAAAAGADGRGVAVTSLEGERIVVARFAPANAPVASRRFGRARVQVRSWCDDEVNVLVLEAKRAGRRIPIARVIRSASFGRARGAIRVGARSYDLTRARTRVAVRLRPRSGRARTLRLRLHRCG